MGNPKCGNCGKELTEEQKFCPECGTPVKNEAMPVSNNKAISKSFTKIIIGILVGFIVAVFFVVFFVVLKPIDIDPALLLSEYLTDVKYSDRKYTGMPVKMTGKMLKIIEVKRDPEFGIIMNQQLSNVHKGRWVPLIVTTEKYKNDANFINTLNKLLKKGDYVTMEGTCLGFVEFRGQESVQVKLDKITY